MSTGLQIVIPMAGRGQRFADAGYALPKPFIEVNGAPMIKRVMENLAQAHAHYVLLAQREHIAEHPEPFAQLKERTGAQVIPVEGVTEGAACTVLLAQPHWDETKPLLIANADQLVEGGVSAFLADANARALDGSILVFREPARDPKWSYARLGPHGLVAETREKQAISELATVGIYWFRRAGDFAAAAAAMIARDERTNGEFYVCPVFNELIAQGKKIGVYEIPATAMHGLGTPDDLRRYLAGAA